MDLISFYILRTQSDDTGVDERRARAVADPVPDGGDLRHEADTFDVVIFQNFGYTDPALSIAQYERNLERYIHNGGAFVDDRRRPRRSARAARACPR